MALFRRIFKSRKQPFNWYSAYFALAALDVLTVLISFSLNVKLTNDYAESVALNKAWAARLSTYAELSLAAQEVNAPGNDVFDSHNPTIERARMTLALSQFQTQLQQARRELDSLQDRKLTPLLRDLTAIEQTMGEMVGEANLIFGFFANDRAADAGKRMATMDRKYAKVNAALGNLSKNVRSVQQSIFEAQLETAQTLRKIEYMILFLVGLMVFGAVRYGKYMMQAAKQAEAERKRIETMKTEFISTVSHELRTPLTSLLGTVRLIKGGMVPEQKMASMIELAYRNGERLQVLINDLLDLEKSTSGNLEMNLQLQALMPLINQALEACATYSSERQITLVCTTQEVSAHAEVDGQRFQQVLLNLLSNAIKFSPPGMQVQLALELRGALVRISIHDDGPGVPAAFRERIFQKFAQADSSDTRAKGGTGLGLAIAKDLIEAMNGTIGFVSEPGQGSTFYMELPLAEPGIVN
jgi:signal transduction histidine kinase